MPFLRQITSAPRWLARWPIALAVTAALAAAVLLPALGAPGIWEPQERQLVDRVAPPQELEAERAIQQIQQVVATLPELTKLDPAAPRQPAANDSCVRTPPKDAIARSLSQRAVRFGRDQIEDSDAGRRLPLAVFGLITVLAAAGVAMRVAGARAGIVTAMVLLSMPLLGLQARLVTSELGTACGASLIVYGLVALARPCGSRAARRLDVVLAVVAVTAGVVLGFAGGGALLGLVVPIGAFAAAGSLGLPLIAAMVSNRRTGDPPRLAEYLPAMIATVVAAGLVGWLAYQLYDLRDPYPGIVPPARQLLGRAIVPGGCWSSALGAIWRPEDDVRFIFDSTFEQIAYGTFPWGVLAPIAMAALLRDPDRDRRFAGALALAWAGGAWIASEAFQRKVGFTVWAGFPSLALALGVWLDGVLARRPPRADEPGAPGGADPMPGARLIGLYAVLAVVVLGKDMFSFAEKVTSLLVGSDTIAYPTMARVALVPTKLWPFALGTIVAVAVAIMFVAIQPDDRAPRPRQRQRTAAAAATIALATTLVLAGFWVFAWHADLSLHLSSKAMFETYRELRAPGDELIVMGDLGTAPRSYADAIAQPPGSPATEPPASGTHRLETATSRDQIVSALKRPNRVFAIAPQSEICALHREIGDRPYFVVDDRNARSYLLSNRVDGTTDKNPLATMIVHAEPKGIPTRPKGRVVWDNKIELLGWDVPKRAGRGEKFEVVLYYKILCVPTSAASKDCQPISGNWKTLMHFDGQGRAGIGDHDPINGRCATSTWQSGDYIIDRFTASAGGGAYPAGPIEVWTGFFTGSSPSFRNMTLSDAPGDMRDQHDRVKITGMILD